MIDRDTITTSRSRSPLRWIISVAALALIALAMLRPNSSAAQESRPIRPRNSAPVPAPPGSTLAKVRAAGVLRCGADASGGAPFWFGDPNDPAHVIGFEVDIMQAIAAKMGVRLEHVQADWLALFDMLKAERCDVLMCGFEVTEDRAKQADFSVPYYRYGEQLTVRAEDRDRFKSLDDLRGHAITVLNGSAAIEALKEAGWSDDLIKQYDDSLAPYTEVALGRADASLAESIIAAYYAGSDPRLVNQPTLFSFGEYAAVLRKGDRELLDEINAILQEMKTSGELGAIYQRWGIWNDDQRAIGVARGSDQEMIGLARSPSEEGGSTSEWRSIVRALAKGVMFTILLTIISMPSAVIFGLVLALGTMHRRWWIRWPALAYVIIVRGTPLLVQVYLVYFSLPPLGAWLYSLAPGFFAALGLSEHMLTWPNLLVGVLCLSGNYAAYEAEIHRAGLQAVPKGQREAAASLGLSRWQAFRYIVFPQSFRIVLPPIVNDLNSMIKDSCLVSVIGVPELLQTALGVGKSKFIVPKMMVIAAAVYLALCAAADWMGRRLEAQLKRSANAAPSGSPSSSLGPPAAAPRSSDAASAGVLRRGHAH